MVRLLLRIFFSFSIFNDSDIGMKMRHKWISRRANIHGENIYSAVCNSSSWCFTFFLHVINFALGPMNLFIVMPSPPLLLAFLYIIIIFKMRFCNLICFTKFNPIYVYSLNVEGGVFFLPEVGFLFFFLLLEEISLNCLSNAQLIEFHKSYLCVKNELWALGVTLYSIKSIKIVAFIYGCGCERVIHFIFIVYIRYTMLSARFILFCFVFILMNKFWFFYFKILNRSSIVLLFLLWLLLLLFLCV